MLEKIRKFPILVAIIALAIGYCGIQYLPYDGSSVMQMTLVRVLLSAILIGIMILMGAKKYLQMLRMVLAILLKAFISQSCFFKLITEGLGFLINSESREITKESKTSLVLKHYVHKF